MKILFWGSSDFSVPFLRLLLSKGFAAAVVTNPDRPYGRGMTEIHRTPVKILAQEAGLTVYQPETLRDQAVIDELNSGIYDLSVVVSYGKIIPDALLYAPRLHSINVHASLLPAWRGASPIQAAIASGDKETGVSVQFMTRALDQGDVIASGTLSIGPDELYSGLSVRLANLGVEVLDSVLPAIADGSVKRIPQDHVRATYSRLIKKEDGAVSIADERAVDIYNKWRAYSEWPGVYTEHGPHRLKIALTDIRPLPGECGALPGTILQANRQGLVFQCREGALDIRRVKPAGKKDMDHMSFINGYLNNI